MTVVFIAAMSVFNVVFSSYLARSGGVSVRELLRTSFVSAEELSGASDVSYSGLAIAESVNSVDIALGTEQQEGVRFMIIDSAALLSTSNPLSNIIPTREGLMIYKVQKGDTLSRIAANFGVSVNTILWANENLKANSLRPGQEIVVLPVTGVLHQIQEGDTLESIATQYSVSADRILAANPNLIPSKILSISSIIIPDSRPVRADRSSGLASLPSLPGFFAIPTTGWNWGKLHNYNAVDIANACGTPIYAAAEGLIVEESSSGWNDGYGTYIVIEHPNNTRTKYAHNQRNLVSIGDYVLKGDQIGVIGNTGLTHGPTGCHLHFEVRGARNPFSK